MIATVNGKNRTPTPVAITPQTRQAKLGQTLRDLRRRFGDNAIMQLGETPNLKVEVISTGYPELDIALGVGGLPRGRIIDICGPESSGKTTLCLKVIGESQQQGGICAFIDMEQSLDLAHATCCGVNVPDLYLAQPATGEEALEIAEAMVRTGTDVVVIDSAASLTPRPEIEGEMGDHHAGLQGRLMSQALRKLAGPVRRNNTVLIFTNQLRVKLGVLFGSPETPTGGMALRFYLIIALGKITQVRPYPNEMKTVYETHRVLEAQNREMARLLTQMQRNPTLLADPDQPPVELGPGQVMTPEGFVIDGTAFDTLEDE